MASAASKLARAARSAAAARHVADPRLPQRGFAGDTTPAVWTRPLLAYAAAAAVCGRYGPRLFLRRGLATLPAGEDSAGMCSCLPEGVTPEDLVDEDGPYSPADPDTCFHFDERDLASEEALWALYEWWCRFHCVTRDDDEKARRFDTFKDNARYIYQFNKSRQDYKLGLNRFSDSTEEERRRRLNQVLLRNNNYSHRQRLRKMLSS